MERNHHKPAGVSGGTRKLWRFSLPFLKRHPFVATCAMVALLASCVAQLWIPFALKQLIDAGLAVKDLATINAHFVSFLAVNILFGILVAARFYVVAWLGESFITELRQLTYRRVIQMNATFFESRRTGELLSRLSNDMALLQGMVGGNIAVTLRSTLTLTGGLIGMIVTSAQLTLITVVVLIMGTIPLVIMARRVRSLSRASLDRLGEANGWAAETFGAVKAVHAFTLEDFCSARYAREIHDSFAIGVRRSGMQAIVTGMIGIFVFGGMIVVMWIGSYGWFHGILTFGELSQFALCATYVGMSAANLSNVWSQFQRGVSAIDRVTELHDAASDADMPLVTQESFGDSGIEFVDVSFSYPSRPHIAALSRFSLRIDHGETIAIVGPSGAGKSTLFQLLLRFNEPTEGFIVVDGVNIAQADHRAVRRHIAAVAQDTALFAMNVRENIRLGRPDASDAEVEAAARAAAAEEFIGELPQGYDTLLGERGALLSGGQRQRIAIARAVLKNSPILLLDEATSSLDSENEALVRDALARLMENRTTIIIAHRFSTIRNARRIVVMDQGRIVATGDHDQLMLGCELYRRLASAQMQEKDRQPAAIAFATETAGYPG